MKQEHRLIAIGITIFVLICVGHFSVSATELENSATTEERMQEDSSEIQSEEQNIVTEEATEEVESVKSEDSNIDNNENSEIATSEENANNSLDKEEINTDESQIPDIHTDDLSDIDGSDTKENIDLEELVNKDDDNMGLYYYLQKYQYQSLSAYLEKNLEYIDLQLQSVEQMYDLGDVTETVVLSYQSQKALVKSQLQIAQNESGYYNLYLEKNGLDYSDHDIKAVKNIESIEYYIENYPEKDYMTVARYVTDYNNAVSGIEAKQVEISYLEEEVKRVTLLYSEGEISKLEMVEKEVSLAKAQYELEQQYVEMNVAYLYVIQVCGE